jgi:hypothetical protein
MALDGLMKECFRVALDFLVLSPVLFLFSYLFDRRRLKEGEMLKSLAYESGIICIKSRWFVFKNHKIELLHQGSRVIVDIVGEVDCRFIRIRLFQNTPVKKTIRIRLRHFILLGRELANEEKSGLYFLIPAFKEKFTVAGDENELRKLLDESIQKQLLDLKAITTEKKAYDCVIVQKDTATCLMKLSALPKTGIKEGINTLTGIVDRLRS